MQKDPLISALVGALFLGALGVLLLVGFFQLRLSHIRKLQPQLVDIQTKKVLIDALARDAVEYSKHNPAIDPLLQTVGMKPGGKPSTK